MDPIRHPPALLVSAKKFLAWDRFPELAIQLIRLDRPVAYFFPPNNGHPTILVFYTDDRVREALFLLFHEAGHAVAGQAKDPAAEPVAIEAEAWRRGRELFEEFCRGEGLSLDWLAAYDAFARESLVTYE